MVPPGASETARIQRSVGVAAFAISFAMVLVNMGILLFRHRASLLTAFAEPAVWMLAVAAVVSAISIFVIRWELRIAQVAMFLASATFAAAVTTAGDLAPAMLLVYAFLLALQYNIFAEKAVFHYLAFLVIYTGGLGVAVWTGALTVPTAGAKLLATLFFLYLMWIALGHQLHIYRTTAEITSAENVELERLVQIRTRELEQALEEKTILVQEIHHRVKNNLGIISSMLTLQAGNTQSEVAERVLEDIQHRIYAMALIHEELYNTDSLSHSSLAEYVYSLGETIAQSYGIDARKTFRVDIDDITLPMDKAIPCGMILAECITNSVKHAFPDDRPPIIEVSARRIDGQLHLRLADNGVGVPPDVSVENPSSFGLWLIRTLVVQQLHGTVKLDTSAGTAWELVIPLCPRSAEKTGLPQAGS